MELIYKKSLGILCILLIFMGCENKQDSDLKIGFFAGLSGKYSNLGVSSRDGFMLAFDEINYTIKNQKIQIIEKDDQQKDQKAKETIEYFVDNNIKLIVGNTTSSMTKVALPLIPKDTLLLSSTASSSFFTKKEDNLLRIQVDNSSKRYISLAKSFISKGYKNIFFIYDSKNKAHTDDYNYILEKNFIDQGGKKYIGKMDLNSKYSNILAQLQKTQSDVIVIAGNSVDSASIIQYLRLHNIHAKIFVSGWAKTNDFIMQGGKAIEGVLFSGTYDENSQDKRFLRFKTAYENKYKKSPSVFALQGYELAQIIIQNLRNSMDVQTLKQRILQIKRYDGLQGDIIFDKYGDVMRNFFMMEVRNSKFVVMDD